MNADAFFSFAVLCLTYTDLLPLLSDWHTCSAPRINILTYLFTATGAESFSCSTQIIVNVVR